MGTYYVVDAADSTSLAYTGNYNNGNGLWRSLLPAGWYDCGAGAGDGPRARPGVTPGLVQLHDSGLPGAALEYNNESSRRVRC